MKWNKLSLCFHPTTVVFVDDQESFLTELKQGVDDSLLGKFYPTPQEALDYFNHQKSDYFTQHCSAADEDSPLENRLGRNTDLRRIHHEIYNSHRFKQTSVLVADYAMPGMNGLECCQAVHDPYLKKFLLTGEAQYDLAVNAFNEKFIDKFVKKSAENLMAVINTTVGDLQMRHFLDLSASIAAEQLPLCLSDPAFIDLFFAIFLKKMIVEFYLLDRHGSFLLLDRHAKPYWLIVKEESEVENAHEFASFSKAGSAVLTALKNKEKIPYFHSDADFNTPPENWEKYLHTASKLVGKQNYYYALLEDSGIYKIAEEKVVSLQSYMSGENLK